MGGNLVQMGAGQVHASQHQVGADVALWEKEFKNIRFCAGLKIVSDVPDI